MSALPIIQGTAEWLEARSRCITATDIAAILGLHPYKSPAQVYMDKVGLSMAVEENDAMRTGTHLEPSIAEWFAAKHEIEVVRADFTLHPEEPIFGASPDYLIAPNKLLECKWCGQNAARGFGDGPDDVPTHYLLQVQWQLFVTGRKTGFLCVLGPWGFREYTIHADSELHRRMAHQARIFWGEYVTASNPPPLSGSFGDKKMIEELHPVDDGQMVTATYELEDEIAELGKELIKIDELSKLAEGRKNRIKQFMGDAAYLESQEGKFSWKSTKDRTETDWQAVAAELAQTAKVDLLEAAKPYSQTKPGYRRFTTPWRTEKA
jgi:putative phage-type endonuclease